MCILDILQKNWLMHIPWKWKSWLRGYSSDSSVHCCHCWLHIYGWCCPPTPHPAGKGQRCGRNMMQAASLVWNCKRGPPNILGIFSHGNAALSLISFPLQGLPGQSSLTIQMFRCHHCRLLSQTHCLIKVQEGQLVNSQEFLCRAPQRSGDKNVSKESPWLIGSVFWAYHFSSVAHFKKQSDSSRIHIWSPLVPQMTRATQTETQTHRNKSLHHVC